MNLKDMSPLQRLEKISKILRSEDGCPWDREQTSISLKPYLIEESYEVYDAIESGNSEDIKEELGDLLYQVYAHSQIASETGEFTIDDVANGICEKLVRRHPHVFGDENARDSNAVKQRWEEIKKTEKSNRRSILEGVPNHLPALVKAYRIQEKVSHIGFDWECVEDAVLKIDEELEEFKEVVKLNDKKKMLDEAGDILFSIVNVLRHQKIDPEEALRSSSRKFTKRFQSIENEAEQNGQDIHKMSAEEMNILWEKCKGQE